MGPAQLGYQMEMASTGINGLGRRPVTTTRTIKYQNSKLQNPKNKPVILIEILAYVSQKLFANQKMG